MNAAPGLTPSSPRLGHPPLVPLRDICYTKLLYVQITTHRHSYDGIFFSKKALFDSRSQIGTRFLTRKCY